MPPNVLKSQDSSCRKHESPAMPRQSSDYDSSDSYLFTTWAAVNGAMIYVVPTVTTNANTATDIYSKLIIPYS